MARVSSMRQVVLSVLLVVGCLAGPNAAQAPVVPVPAAQRPIPGVPPEECKDANGNPCLLIGVEPGDDEVDWDGPDVVTRSVIDVPCFSPDTEIEKFRIFTAGIASSVPAQTLTYDQAIANVRRLFASAKAGDVLGKLRSTGRSAKALDRLELLGVVAAAQGNQSLALASLVALHEAAPNDPSLLFSLAGALTFHKMPNEAIALLDRIAATKQLPEVAFGFRPESAVDYLRGYTSLMTGRLEEAKRLLDRAYGADKTNTDASYALAIAENALGGDPWAPMLKGYLPSYTGDWMFCGDSFALDPTVRRDEEVGPEADDLLDLSKGTFGVLPSFSHPGNGERLIRMVEDMLAESPALMDEMAFYERRAREVYESRIAPRFAAGTPSVQDVGNQALFDMINENRASLRVLQRLRVEREKASEEAVEAGDRSIDLLAEPLRQLTLMGDTQSEARKALARTIVGNGLNRRRTTLNGWDTALRKHFRMWHKYATGVAGHMTDDAWREYADFHIKHARAVAWYSLYTGVIAGYFAYLPASREIYEPDPPLPRAPHRNDQLWRCSESAQKSSLEHAFLDGGNLDPGDFDPRDIARAPGAGASNLKDGPWSPPYEMKANINCDKVSLELGAQVAGVEAGTVGASLGGFLEGSVDRGGDMTLYGGAKAEVGVAPLFKGELKDGLAIVWNQEDGLKEIVLRIDASLDLEALPFKRNVPLFGQPRLREFRGEDPLQMKFTIWVAPERPPKHDPKNGLLNFRNR